ncbi:MAG: TRAP transporter large permease [Sphingomonadaceae bacterium]|nr:TRAP transporter large permease [Sphingomonadaceae bacterium]
MATPETGLVGVAVLLVLLVMGVPIGAALGLVGIVGLTLTIGLEPALIKSGVTAIETLTRYELGTLPLFMLMAHLLFSANASRDLFDAAARLFGHRRGGLAYAAIGGCASFGAINGSSLATTATVGLVALPEMRSRGYAPGFAAGTVAVGGTLGQLIPPSGALIVFGIIAEQSLGKLFAAALVPAALQILFYLVTIAIVVRLRPSAAPASERHEWRARMIGLWRVADLLLLILFVIGGIALGWFSPSEAASIGVGGALLLAARRRQLNRAMLYKAFEETLRTSGMILLVIIGALIFSVFLSVTGLAEAIGADVAGLGLGQTLTLAIVAIILLVLGSMLDGLGLMLLATPILMPVVTGVGLSEIWFGIFLIRTIEIGFVHPPLGLNLYVIHGVAPDIPVSRIFRGVAPYLLADIICLALLILFPALVTALPRWAGL